MASAFFLVTLCAVSVASARSLIPLPLAEMVSTKLCSQECSLTVFCPILGAVSSPLLSQVTGCMDLVFDVDGFSGSCLRYSWRHMLAIKRFTGRLVLEAQWGGLGDPLLGGSR